MDPESVIEPEDVNAPILKSQEFHLTKEMIEKMIHMDGIFLESIGIKVKNPVTDNLGNVEFRISFRSQFKWLLTIKTRQGGDSENCSQKYKGSVHLQSNKSVCLGDAMKFNFPMINKVLLQHIYNLKVMKAKIGHEAWSPDLPLKRFLFVGFDVHRPVDRSNPQSYHGIMVANAGTSFCSFFTASSHHPSTEEVGRGLCLQLSMVVESYYRRRGFPPSRIILLRGGIIGASELSHCFTNEIEHVNKCMKLVYASIPDVFRPKLDYIAVTQRNKKLSIGGATSSSPATCVLPDKFDYTEVPRAPKRRGRKRKAKHA